MVATWVFFTVASAQTPVSQAVPPGDFQVTAGAVQAQVEQYAVPVAREVDGDGRCAVRLSWDGQAAVLRRTACPEALAADVDAALAQWHVAVRGGSEPVELAELWFVYPVDVEQGVRLFVRPQAGRELVVRVPEVDVLSWRLTTRAPVAYPAEALQRDTLSSTCVADVDADGDGFPLRVEVSGCDEVFAGALREALRDWRFAGAVSAGGRAVPAGLTLRARFVRVAEQTEVEIDLPEAPDLGKRAASDAPVRLWVAPPPPTGPPLFVVDHKSFAEVQVYEVVWPEVPAAKEERRCEVLVQVNSVRRVWAWSERCDEEVRTASEQAAARWILTPGALARGERLARFRGTFVFPANADHPMFWVPVDDLTSPERELPEHVHTQRSAKAIVTVPPQLPKEGVVVAGEGDEAVCDYIVQVDPRGRPAGIAPNPESASWCPPEVDVYTRRTLGRWRWTPAAVDGRSVASTVTARLRVDGLNQAGQP
jgi:hypothetical protein